MFKLNDYVKNTFVAQDESPDGVVTINLNVNVDKEQIHSDCETLVEMLENLQALLESNYSITVTEDKIIFDII